MAELPSFTEQALVKLEEQLTCGVCQEQYTRPKLLHCFHVFCEKCLQPLACQSAQGQVVECPNCCQSTPLPQSGVPGLQEAFLMHHQFNIRDTLRKASNPTNVQCDKCEKREPSCYCLSCRFLCDRCKDFHSEWKEFSSHMIISLDQLKADINFVPPVHETFQCSEHPDKQLNIYCETCEELICNNCIAQVHKHHQYDLVNDAYFKHKKVIEASLQPLEKQLAIINTAMENLDARCSEITEQYQAIEIEIKKNIQLLYQTVNRKEEDLISQLAHLSQGKLENLAGQREELNMVATQLKSCWEFVQETLRIGSQRDILTITKPLILRVNEMSKEIEPDFLLPKEQSNIVLEYADMMSVHNEAEPTQAFLQSSLPSVSSVNCQAAGPGTQVAMAGELTSATLHARAEEGREYLEPVEMSCEPVPSDGASQIRCEVEGNGEGKYKISYSLQDRGYHQLQNQVEGSHISWSPFTGAELTTTPTSTIKYLSSPWGVEISKAGQVIVAEHHRHCISIFNPNGDKVASFGIKGSDLGQLKNPTGVAITAARNILVCDHGNHRIQLFSSDGRAKHIIGTRGDGPLQFQHPYAVAVNHHSGNIYIADTGNHRIQILKSDFTFCSSFGGQGTDSGNFSLPEDITFDRAGNVFVCDWGNHRIQVFTENGVYIRQFGKEGEDDGELNSPRAIAIDSNDVVYIADGGNHRISLFTRDGHFLRAFGAWGCAPGQFNRPLGLTIDEDDTLFISDTDNDRIQVF